ncbi:MAG: hypothetical protein O9345_16150 [Burkholderiaceae bacterium]|nr:hypothetical protein [Burkholderiales bacterium]MCZ8339658.1 hypothetical protein [Burkholderiaceae bacterium]
MVDKLNEPDVSITRVSEATGIPARTLHHLKGGAAHNAWSSRIDVLAAFFGYRFEPVPVTGDQRREATGPSPASTH